MKNDSTKKIIRGMLKENTGTHMLDSGGDNGRMWQRNQDKDFDKEPYSTLRAEKWGRSLEHRRDSFDISFSVRELDVRF